MRKTLLTAIATVLAGTILVPAASAAAPTIVTFTFDDGMDNQFQNAAPVLEARGYPATFYVNSGNIGGANYMTWSELAALEADGFEVGGHTTNHTNLVTATPEQREAQVCGDRDELRAHGLNITSFAYPHGAWIIPNGMAFGDRETIPAVVKGCGYQTARTTGGIDFSGEVCDVCAAPLDDVLTRPHNTRALQLSKAVETDTAQEAISAIQRARKAVADNEGGFSTDGGWIQLVLHEICDADDADCNDSDYAMTTADFQRVVDWLHEQPASDCYVVKSTRDVMDATAEDLACPAPASPTISLTAPSADGPLSGSVAVAVDAVDDRRVTKVDFYAGDTPIGSDTTAPYSVQWDTTAGADGSTTIRAVATDNDTLTAQATRAVVVDNIAPTVSFTQPASGAKVTAGTQVSLSANASDSNAISKVEFFAGDQLVGTSAGSTHTVLWNVPASAGPVTLSAKATDTAGRTTTTTRNVTVAEAPTPDPGQGGGGGGGGGGGAQTGTTPATTAVQAPSQTQGDVPFTDLADAGQIGSPGQTLSVRLLAAPSKLLSRGIVRFRPAISAGAGIVKVEHLVNGRVIATTKKAPHAVHWRSQSARTRAVRLSVRVTDTAGAVAQSGTIKVRVAGTAAQRRSR